MHIPYALNEKTAKMAVFSPQTEFNQVKPVRGESCFKYGKT
jgi:hypothetical protein